MTTVITLLVPDVTLIKLHVCVRVNQLYIIVLYSEDNVTLFFMVKVNQLLLS